MALIKEFLNGGVVTARDPSLLQPTELQQADECILRPSTPALYKAPGRLAYGTVTSSQKIKGLAQLAFDGANDLLVAYADTKIRYADYTSIAAPPYTFTDLVTGLPAAGTETMDAIQYGGKHYLTLGSGARIQRIGYGDGVTVTGPTARAAGMIPVDVLGVTSTSSGAAPYAEQISGTFPSVLGAGYYWFLVTEVLFPGTPDEVESTYVGDPVYAAISDVTTQTIKVHRRRDDSTTIFYNDGTDGKNTATHWRVYMSPTQPDVNTTPTLGSFQSIRTIPMATASFTISATTATTGPNCATANAAEATPTAQFTNPSNMHGAASSDNVFNNTYAVASGSGASAQVLRNFGFSSPANVTGIRVKIKFKTTTILGRCSFMLALSKNNGASIYTSTNWFKQPVYEIPVNQRGRDVTMEFGGENDLWGATWNATDFNNGTFALLIYHPAAPAGATVFPSLSVDGIIVELIRNDSAVDSNGNFFPVVNVDTGVGIITTFGANFPPPNATTGDIFQGQFVVNDPVKPPSLRYSLTDQPEYFPQPYVLTFESKQKDEVNFLRTVNNILVVGMTNGLKRVNWLPREQDAEFNGARAWEDITTTHGILGPQCGTLFELADSGPLLAYSSQNGLWVTDGMTTRLLNRDLDWTNLIAAGYEANVVLRNYPKLRVLAMYYTPVGATSNTKCFYFSYDPIHVKNGELPAVGPVTVSAASAAETVLNGQHVLLTGHNSDGKVYIEDNGISDASGGTIAPTIKLREIYFKGEGEESRVDRVYIHHQAFGANGSTAVCSATLSKHNIGESLTTLETTTFNTDLRGLSVMHNDNSAESHTVTISKADLAAGMAIDYVGFFVSDLGTEEHYA